MVFHPKASQSFPGRLLQASSKLQTDSCQGFTHDTITYMDKLITALIFRLHHHTLILLLFSFSAFAPTWHCTRKSHNLYQNLAIHLLQQAMLNAHMFFRKKGGKLWSEFEEELIVTPIYPDPDTTGGGRTISVKKNSRRGYAWKKLYCCYCKSCVHFWSKSCVHIWFWDYILHKNSFSFLEAILEFTHMYIFYSDKLQ